ncbi:hypothetical protein SETIT_2G383200v2 [Setaria italica]|uniref:Uncharacterized protein n=1 Tax=Setaria italica TaxID=4555 RepID=A0A368Q7A0_SETIT|nr:hypothetical protein SETIT_2G383200v2 [Setaria italica]
MAFPAGTPARKLLLPGISAKAGSVAVGFDLDGALVKAKAAEILAYLATLFSALAKKVDELLPPDTRSETLRQWLHVAVTVVLPAALGALVLLCVARCCWRCCCARNRAPRGRLMVAPGRGGARMPRDVFEDDPRRYFRDLRARKPLVY